LAGWAKRPFMDGHELGPMDTYTAPPIKASQFAPSKPIDEYSEESIKNIAVLFTDIVGSSKFFKNLGVFAPLRENLI
jgi:hypothetical protein